MPKKNSARKSTKVVKRQAASSPILDLSDSMIRSNIVESDIDYKINHHYNLSPIQQAFLETIQQTSTKMCIVDGPAGTAKTYIAVLAALKWLLETRFSPILTEKAALIKYIMRLMIQLA
jgi:phosphate starvation-inducible protein PhoH